MTRSLYAATLLAFLTVPASAAVNARGVGQPLTLREITVTLLGATHMTRDEYARTSGEAAPAWKGDALRLVFLVENRPGATLPPALGEIRVLFATDRYNDVTSFASQKPFAPDVIIRTPDDFFSRPENARFRSLAPATGKTTQAAEVLDVIVRGGPIPADVLGTVELEQGETFHQAADGSLRELTPAEIGASWVTFTFVLPRFSR